MDDRRLTGFVASYTLDQGWIREGGEAFVYRTRFADRSAAVKVARRAGNRLSREREALERLASRVPDAREWMVTVLDHGHTPDGREFMVLDWYEGTVGDWLEAGPPTTDILLVLERCAETVTRLHRASELREQLLHRDVKPSNFLIDPKTLRVVLSDLGGVKEGRMLATTQYEGMHSPGFAPAEQALPLSRAPDPSLDAHGLAATVYFGVCGRLPDARATHAGITADARRLIFLHAAGPSGRDSGEEADYQELRRCPPEQLLDLANATALTEADVARFTNRLRDGLAEYCPDAGERARALSRILIPELKAALDPDPRTRSREVRRLYAALADARESLGPMAQRAERTVVPERAPEPRSDDTWSPHDASGAYPVVTPSSAPGPSRALAMIAALTLAFGLAVVVVVAIGWWWWMRREPAPEPPPAPEASAPATIAEPAATEVAAPAAIDEPAAPLGTATMPSAKRRRAEAAPDVTPLAPPQDPPAPGDGVVVRIVNRNANIGDARVRIDGADRGGLGNHLVPDGNHSISVFDPLTGEPLNGCSWRVTLRSAAGGPDEFDAGRGTESHADGVPFHLTCG